MASQTIICRLVAVADFRDFVTLDAGLVGLGPAVFFGVGPMRREWSHAIDTGRDGQDQGEHKACNQAFFHGLPPCMNYGSVIQPFQFNRGFWFAQQQKPYVFYAVMLQDSQCFNVLFCSADFACWLYHAKRPVSFFANK